MSAEDARASAPVSARVRRRRWTALSLLVASGAVNYLDRGTLAVANVVIQREMNINARDMGLLLSAFAFSYAFAQIPVGPIIDRFGPRRVLGLGIAAWSTAQTACALVTSYPQFIIARLALGVTESPQFPTAARVTANWFAMRDRGLPTGVFNTASMLGSALAPFLLTWLMLAFGWRWMFAIMGLAGLAVAAIWYAVYRDPAAAGLSEEERASIARGANPAVEGPYLVHWARLFRLPTTWGMVIGMMGLSYLNYIYITWLPAYLEMERHLTIQQTGFAATIPFLFGMLGSLAGGLLSDACGRRGLSPIASRKVPIILGLCGAAACTIAGAFAAGVVVALVFMSASMFFSYVAVAGVWSMPNAIAPQNEVASLGGIQNFGGYLGATAAPAVTGFVVHATGSFVPALLAGAAAAMIGAASVLVVVRAPIRAD